MPDHVHMLLYPLEKENGLYYSLASILGPMKGGSARRINRQLGIQGTVWQKESFDRIVRDGEEWREKYEYIRNNPVTAGLAAQPEHYPWLIDGEHFINRP